jgi:hypothetical protein
MADWLYVWLAYGVVWGALAAYLLALYRRLGQAATAVKQVRSEATAPESSRSREVQACDAPSVP